MSNYLINNNNIDNFNFEDIIIGTKIITSDIKSKHYIYYHKNGESPKDIYIRLPKVRLIYTLANSKYTQLSIPLYPNWNELDIMIKFIKKLEKNIIEKIDGITEYSNIISKKNKIYFLKTNYGENNIKITSNLSNQKKILLSDFKINGEIEMVIKLDYIWIKNKKCGLSINLYQIKYYSPATQNDIDFIDENIPTILIPRPPLLPLMVEPEKQIILDNRPKLNISSKDLKNAIKKLKPIE